MIMQNPMIEGDEEQFEPFDAIEDDNLKRMQVLDENFFRKINEADSQFVRPSLDKATALRSS